MERISRKKNVHEGSAPEGEREAEV